MQGEFKEIAQDYIDEDGFPDIIPEENDLIQMQIAAALGHVIELENKLREKIDRVRYHDAIASQEELTLYSEIVRDIRKVLENG